MTPRRQRLVLVGLVVVGVGLATAFALRAFQENLAYFYSPTELANGEAPTDRKIRVGGLVTPGSVARETGSMEVRFVLTDTANSVPVVYSGILPDLFREGQGIIATGQPGPDGEFHADEVLAKHDENYMPPEVADAIEEAGHPGGG